jgi:uncharacterized RDD family membrane protein YckC
MPAVWATSTWSYPGSVSRVTGSWLSGGVGESGDADQEWPGARLGLPEEGPGSVAGRGARFGALVVDLVLMGLVTSLFFRVDVQDVERMRQFNYLALLVWFVVTVLMVGVFGFTPGKMLFGLRVVRVDGKPLVTPLRAIPRTLLLGLVVPAALSDADNRGLHDKLTGTVVVRTR